MAPRAGTLLAILGALGPLGLDRGLDLARALAALTAPLASDRSRAERWIAVHSEPADFPALARAVEDGDAELCARITRALGADDRHLGLALAFANERAPQLEGVGVEAVRDLLGHWSEGLGDPLAAAQPNDLRLREALVNAREIQPGRIYRIALEGASLQEVVDRLVRLAELSLPVAVDPLLGEGPIEERGAVLEGTWDQILLGLAAHVGATLEGALATDGRARRIPVFVCLRPAQTSRMRTAHEALLEWCRLSLGQGPVATRAARALAETCWPAALAWLEERWVESGDARALHGLLVAAGRGRVVPALERPEVVRALLAEADLALELGDALSLSTGRRIGHALAAFGPVASDGSRLDEILAPGDSRRPSDRERSLLLRLVVLEGMSSTSERVAADVARCVAAPAEEVAVGVRRQALRTWSKVHVVRSGDLVLGDPEGVLRALVDREDACELARLLLVGGVDLPANLRDTSATVAFGSAARSAVFDWLFGRGEDDPAAGHLLEACRLDLGLFCDPPILAARDHFGAVLRDWVKRGDGARVGAWLEGLGEKVAKGDARLALHSLAVLAGAVVPEREGLDSEFWRVLSRGEEGAAVLGREELFGALAAHSSDAISGPARVGILRRLAEGPERGVDREVVLRVLRGVERAIEDLQAQGADHAASLLISEARETIQRRPDARSKRPILAPAWPSGRRVDLDRLERSIE